MQPFFHPFQFYSCLVLNKSYDIMIYSTDFKQGALDYIKEGHRHVEAAKVFDVGVRTLFTWEKKDVNKGI